MKLTLSVTLHIKMWVFLLIFDYLSWEWLVWGYVLDFWCKQCWLHTDAFAEWYLHGAKHHSCSSPHLSPAVLGMLNTCPPLSHGEWIPCFVLLMHTFVLHIKLSSPQPMHFYALTLPILFLIPQEETGISCAGAELPMGINPQHLLCRRLMESLSICLYL